MAFWHARNPTQAIVRLISWLSLLAQVLLADAQHEANQCSASVPITLRPRVPEATCPLPTNDIWLTQGSPWTHPPSCEYSSDRTTKYCAYTNSRHGPRGWSIVTSPETAADWVGFLDEPLNASRLAGSQDDPPYKVVEIPGKGKGLVATRSIKLYEEILFDYATVLVDIMFTTKVSAFIGYRLLHLAVERLRDPASVLGLGKSTDLAQDVVENILRTNSFHTDLGEKPHIALYPAVSRINHACKPNAYTRFMPESLQVSVGAAKDIQEGEEITISYLSLGKTFSERQPLLKKWGFDCQCSLCTAPEAEKAASDARRREVMTLRENAVRAFQAGKPYQALRLTRQVIGLLPSEELFPLYSEQYENMARIFFVLRDMENAEKYARLSLETLAEQGYVREVRDEHLEIMWKRFRDEEKGRY